MKTDTGGFFILWLWRFVLKTNPWKDFCLILPFFLLVSCSENIQLSKPEAERSLKVLNSDLTNLLSEVNDSEVSKAIEFVWGQETSPVPFKKERYKIWPSDTAFALSSHGGYYKWESENGAFRKVLHSDSVSLEFPSLLEPETQLTLIISEFESEKHLSKPSFPVRIVMQLFKGDEELMKLEHRGVLKDNMPYSINSVLSAGRLEIIFGLSTERLKDKGLLTSTILIEAGPRTLVEGTVDSEVTYTSSSYYFETITPDLKVFDMKVSGSLFYGDIDPTSKDYPSSFNKNCKISFFDLSNRGKVGLLQLDEVNEGEQFDYFVLFNDGSLEPLGKYLLVLNKLLNFKYQ